MREKKNPFLSNVFVCDIDVVVEGNQSKYLKKPNLAIGCLKKANFGHKLFKKGQINFRIIKWNCFFSNILPKYSFQARGL